MSEPDLSTEDELSDVTYRDVLMGDFMGKKKTDPLVDAVVAIVFIMIFAPIIGGLLGLAVRAFMWASGLG